MMSWNEIENVTLIMTTAIDHGFPWWNFGKKWKGLKSVINDHDCDLLVLWWGVRIYQIVTGVTSDVGMPSIFLVYHGIVNYIYHGVVYSS